MAITRDKKNELVAELQTLISDAKLTVFAEYKGLSVADMQELRAKAREADVTIKVLKNRLVRVAIESVDGLKGVDTSAMTGQLLYATSDSDEVAPAQVLHDFAKTHPQLEFAGAFTNKAANIGVDELRELALLPSREQLIAEVIAQLLSPVHDTTNALAGNLHGLLDGIEAKATA